VRERRLSPTGLLRDDPSVTNGAEESIRKLQTEWEALAVRDAFHAVLSDPARAGGRWDADEFYESGRYSIGVILDLAARLGVDVRTGSALELGCGAGRLSFAAAELFDHVVGVDISAIMLEHARKRGIPPNCELIVQDDPALPGLGARTFDFVFSVLVVQHMVPELGRAYLSGIARRVAPGGALLVQVPYEFARTPVGSTTTGLGALFQRFAPQFLVDRRRQRALDRDLERQRAAGIPAFELHKIPRETVRRLLTAEGLVLVGEEGGHDHDAPPYVSAWYVARRPDGERADERSEHQLAVSEAALDE
jgi:SAM-dependent methyltransferase